MATAAAIILLPIQQGVAIGITLSLLHGVWSITRARLLLFERISGTSIWWPANPHIPGETEPSGSWLWDFRRHYRFSMPTASGQDALNALHSSAGKFA